jgi:hypothetical protein
MAKVELSIQAERHRHQQGRTIALKGNVVMAGDSTKVVMGDG